MEEPIITKSFNKVVNDLQLESETEEEFCEKFENEIIKYKAVGIDKMIHLKNIKELALQLKDDQNKTKMIELSLTKWKLYPDSGNRYEYYEIFNNINNIICKLKVFELIRIFIIPLMKDVFEILKGIDLDKYKYTFLTSIKTITNIGSFYEHTLVDYVTLFKEFEHMKNIIYYIIKIKKKFHCDYLDVEGFINLLCIFKPFEWKYKEEIIFMFYDIQVHHVVRNHQGISVKQLYDIQLKLDHIHQIYPIKQEIQENEKEKEKIRKEKNNSYEGKCVICLVEKSNMIFLDCMHLCICNTCLNNYARIDCPMCRLNFISIKQVFFS